MGAHPISIDAASFAAKAAEIPLIKLEELRGDITGKAANAGLVAERAANAMRRLTALQTDVEIRLAESVAVTPECTELEQLHAELLDSIARLPDRLAEGQARHTALGAEAWANAKIGIAVERADYTKGVPQRLRARLHMLRTNPAASYGQDIMRQVAARNRAGVDAYDLEWIRIQMLSVENESEFPGSLDISYSGIPQHDLSETETVIGLYRIASVVFATPVADGLNLTAKEGAVCSNGDVMVTTGAGVSQEWLKDKVPFTLLDNPDNISEHAERMAFSFSKSPELLEVEVAVREAAVFVADNAAWQTSMLAEVNEMAATEAE